MVIGSDAKSGFFVMRRNLEKVNRNLAEVPNFSESLTFLGSFENIVFTSFHFYSEIFKSKIFHSQTNSLHLYGIHFVDESCVWVLSVLAQCFWWHSSLPVKWGLAHIFDVESFGKKVLHGIFLWKICVLRKMLVLSESMNMVKSFHFFKRYNFWPFLWRNQFEKIEISKN